MAKGIQTGRTVRRLSGAPARSALGQPRALRRRRQPGSRPASTLRDEGTDAVLVSRPRLLAIDDLQSVLTTLKKVADELGYQVEATQDPEKFKDLTTSFMPDLILMDVIMPEQDGLDLLRHLASNEISTPIILISDYDEHLLNTVAKIGSALGLNVRAVQKPIGPSAWRTLLTGDGRPKLGE